MIEGTEAEYPSDAESTKDTPYVALTGEPWAIFCKYFCENQLCYNGNHTLYVRYPGSIMPLLVVHHPSQEFGSKHKVKDKYLYKIFVIFLSVELD